MSPSHEVTTYVNPTNNVDKLDTSFTQNIFEKIVSRLLNNLTNPHSEVQGRVHITLSSKFTWSITEGKDRV